MAETMQVELVSPEKLVASVEAEAVMLPGSDGDFTAMPGHVPMATPLRPGRVTVESGGQRSEYLIAGGFAEVSGSGISVLAERIAPRDEATADMFESMLETAQASVDAASDETRAEAQRTFDGLKSMISELSGQ